MNSELSNHVSESVRLDQNAQFRARIFLKCDPCRSPKILGQTQGPQERSWRGAAKSLNTAVKIYNYQILPMVKTDLQFASGVELLEFRLRVLHVITARRVAFHPRMLQRFSGGQPLRRVKNKKF